jgi:hypothetical protein
MYRLMHHHASRARSTRKRRHCQSRVEVISDPAQHRDVWSDRFDCFTQELSLFAGGEGVKLAGVAIDG